MKEKQLFNSNGAGTTGQQQAEKKKKSKPHIIKTNQKTEMEHGLKDTYKTIKPLEKTG